MYLAIDPGRDTGYAVFQDRDHLTACGLGLPWATVDPEKVRTAVIERPQIYNARNMKGDPNDIVTLALGAGEYAGVLRRAGVRVTYVKPHEWKGTTPKEVDNARTIASLSDAERRIVKAAAYHIPTSKQHNMLDAIGFGRACFDKHLWL
jgi:hypothetical protein